MLLYICLPQIHSFFDYIRQTNPFSGQRYIEQSFVPTERELACLRGKPIPGDAPPTAPPTTTRSRTSSTSSTASRAPSTTPGRAVRFHVLPRRAQRHRLASSPRPSTCTTRTSRSRRPPIPRPTLTNPWIRRLAKHVTLIYHPPSTSRAQYAHLSDTMRLEFLRDYGGIYMDIDAFALRPSTSSWRRRGRTTSSSAPRAGTAGACATRSWRRGPTAASVERWLDSYRDIDFSKEWNYHSVLLRASWPTSTRMRPARCRRTPSSGRPGPGGT